MTSYIGDWHCTADLAAWLGCAPEDDAFEEDGTVEEVPIEEVPHQRKKKKKKRPLSKRSATKRRDAKRAGDEEAPAPKAESKWNVLREVVAEEAKEAPATSAKSKWALLRREVVTEKAESPRLAQVVEAARKGKSSWAARNLGGLLSLGSSRGRKPKHFEDVEGNKEISERYGLTVEEVHAKLVEALPGTSITFTRRVVRDHGTNEMGRVSPAECAQLIEEQVDKRDRKKKESRVPMPSFLREKLKGLKRHHSIPLERHENASIKVDRSMLMRPLATPYFVEWRDLINLEVTRADLDTMFANLTDADLVRPDPMTKNTVLMFAAQTGNVILAKELLARGAVRDIVGATNLQGVTALDYAVARGDAQVTDLISTYSRAHLDEDNIDEYLLGEHAARSYRRSRSASCAARGSK